MKPDHGTMAIILSRLAKKDDMKPSEDMMPKEEMDSEEGMDEGKLSASEEMISAIENKDAAAFAEALQAFLDCC
jgi:hypothetical protein